MSSLLLVIYQFNYQFYSKGDLCNYRVSIKWLRPCSCNLWSSNIFTLLMYLLGYSYFPPFLCFVHIFWLTYTNLMLFIDQFSIWVLLKLCIFKWVFLGNDFKCCNFYESELIIDLFCIGVLHYALCILSHNGLMFSKCWA